MPLVPPELDDRTFEAILAEVRRKVPAYTPEWTDLNESDPGITLAQLFAFMTEHLLYQVNQVPEKGFITFLKMVGAELHPATPAVADVTLTNVRRPDTVPFRIIDRGTTVATASPPPGEKRPVAFETDVTFSLLNGELTRVLTQDCEGDVLDRTAANESPTAFFAPFGDARTGREHLYLGLELHRPEWLFPAGTVRFRVDVQGSSDVGHPDTSDDGGEPPRLRWEVLVGSSSGPGGTVLLDWREVDHVADSSLDLTRSGYLELTLDAEGVATKAPAAVAPEDLEGLFVFRATPTGSRAFGFDPPRLRSIRLNTVPVVNLTTVTDEALGSSTGLPFQRFRLAHAPVEPGSVVVEVRESGTTTTWEEVGDLFAAGPDERVFQLLPATGEILFGGDGRGRVLPPDDGTVPEGNVSAARYRFGGGPNGNVGAGTLTRVTFPSPEVRLDATNLLEARGGASEESLARGLARAPAVVRSRWRAVTADDFEALALETPGVQVARALALPNTAPGGCPGSACGGVTVALVPFVPFEASIAGPIDLPPFIARAVRRYLDMRRLLTTEVFTTGATFRRIEVRADLVVAPGESASSARADVFDSLHRYFHALVGGADGLGWPFGGTIFFSRVFERVLSVPGVARVDRLTLSVDGAEPTECDDLPLRPGELLFSGDHDIRVVT